MHSCATIVKTQQNFQLYYDIDYEYCTRYMKDLNKFEAIYLRADISNRLTIKICTIKFLESEQNIRYTGNITFCGGTIGNKICSRFVNRETSRKSKHGEKL